MWLPDEVIRKCNKEGAKKKRLKLQENMLSKGVNRNNIVDFTGLSKWGHPLSK